MDPKLIIYIVLLVFLIFSSALFSASETAYTSINVGRIETLVDKKEFGAKIIKQQHHFFNRTLSTILICNNIVNIASSSIMSYILSTHLHGAAAEYNVLISTAIMTPIIVLLGEIIPKILAKANPVAFCKFSCYILLVLYYIFFIVTYPIGLIGKKVYITNNEEDVKNLIDVAQSEGVLEANESIMAQNALDLDGTLVKKHYVKLKDVVYVNANDSIEDAKEVFKATNYSRIPVMRENELIGIVLLKDIFDKSRGTVIQHFKTIPSISQNITLASALETMRAQRAMMAFVTQNNKDKEILGIITIEDILEEIVGEIYDEYDQEELQKIFEISLGLFHVSADVKMRDLIKQTDIDIDLHQGELKMDLKTWLESRTNAKLLKSTRYETNGITFKFLSFGDKKNKYTQAKIEIELGSEAVMLNDEEKIETLETDINIQDEKK